MTLLEQLKQAPDAVLIMQKVQTHLKEEAEKRREFLDMVHEDIKAEFINGEIILHSPVRLAHLRVSTNLSMEMASYVRQHDLGFVGIEKMMITLSRNCYEPDIVFYRKAVAEEFTDDQKTFPAPDLAVEILSKSTQKNDYGIKFRDYEAHGVGEYWIVDAEKAIIKQYVLVEEKFELQAELTAHDTLHSIIINKFALDLAKIFV
ncbi:MAG: Uma2 family endonuclease [Bernardetiaceae bacterium]|nr:Uma2 family endonuclease [Bernardetiaceae bacterium]